MKKEYLTLLFMFMVILVLITVISLGLFTTERENRIESQNKFISCEAEKFILEETNKELESRLNLSLDIERQLLLKLKNGK